MKLKHHIDKKLSQAYSSEETLDMIVEGIIEDVGKMFSKEEEDEAFMAILDRLKLFMGEE